MCLYFFFFFFQAEDGIRDHCVTGVQTCALPISFQEVPSPQFPRPSEFDLRSFSALQKWDAQVYGFQLPESEFHQKWDSTSDGRAKNLHDFPGSQYLMAVLMGTKKYVKIPVPTLAIFAIPHVPETWMTESTDPGVRKAAAAYFTNVT